MIICDDCGTEVVRTSNVQRRCAPCAEVRQRERDRKRRQDPDVREREREWHRRRRIVRHCGTLENAQRIWDEQNGCCAICLRPFTENPQSNAERWDFHFDHCHETGAFRGFLCAGCNRSIGMLKEDAERMERAAAYVRHHRRARMKVA